MATFRKNSFFGFLGFLIPTLVLFICYPVLVRKIGLEALGIYFLATATSGTLAFLDIGFGSATIKFLAEETSAGRQRKAADFVLASYLFYGAIGALSALGLWISAPELVYWLKVSPQFSAVGLFCFRIAALQFAASFLLTPSIAIFKGLQQFRLSTIVLSLLSLLTYGGATLAALIVNAGLRGIVLISLAANLLAMATAAILAIRLCAAHQIPLASARPTRSVFKKMFGFGSIMTFNSVSNLMLTQVQRYIVSAAIGPSAVTSYQLASVIPQKVHSAVGSFSEAMFPVASAMSDRRNLRRLYLKLVIVTGLLVTALLVPLILLARPVLTLWIGAKTADEIVSLFRLFALAYFFMAFSPAPYHILNGIGRPWVNTVASVLSGVINLSLIGVFAIDGLTLTDFGWAFAVACISMSVMYQLFVEIVVWGRWLELNAFKPELVLTD
jgi:O-antigen/teichoic acid export membrane protein